MKVAIAVGPSDSGDDDLFIVIDEDDALKELILGRIANARESKEKDNHFFSSTYQFHDFRVYRLESQIGPLYEHLTNLNYIQDGEEWFVQDEGKKEVFRISDIPEDWKEPAENKTMQVGVWPGEDDAAFVEISFTLEGSIEKRYAVFSGKLLQ